MIPNISRVCVLCVCACVRYFHDRPPHPLPREGPTLAWTTEFNDLLAANSLSDYIHFSPPERSTFYAMYPKNARVKLRSENAYTATPR
jgi:hypothetical protein